MNYVNKVIWLRNHSIIIIILSSSSGSSSKRVNC